MVKAAKMTPPKTIPDLELNCWCIEMAMKWPVIPVDSLPSPDRPQEDADIIGRAAKIRTWVKEVH